MNTCNTELLEYILKEAHAYYPTFIINILCEIHNSNLALMMHVLCKSHAYDPDLIVNVLCKI